MCNIATSHKLIVDWSVMRNTMELIVSQGYPMAINLRCLDLWTYSVDGWQDDDVLSLCDFMHRLVFALPCVNAQIQIYAQTINYGGSGTYFGGMGFTYFLIWGAWVSRILGAWVPRLLKLMNNSFTYFGSIIFPSFEIWWTWLSRILGAWVPRLLKFDEHEFHVFWKGSRIFQWLP